LPNNQLILHLKNIIIYISLSDPARLQDPNI